jgi:hydroxymethylpyrimidine/phosphomethylpyrimidine kinase
MLTLTPNELNALVTLSLSMPKLVTQLTKSNFLFLLFLSFHHLQADIDFKVVKIGLLCASEQIRVIADLVQDKTIVLDPIIKASSEEALLQTQAIDTLKRVFCTVIVVTIGNGVNPN